MDFIKNIWTEEEGQGLVEYGLILALIAVAVIAILGTMGTSLNTIFTTVNSTLGSATK
ncbi:MAG: Flp family type IVb pilin [Clostridiaceae bacterium]